MPLGWIPELGISPTYRSLVSLPDLSYTPDGLIRCFGTNAVSLMHSGLDMAHLSSVRVGVTSLHLGQPSIVPYPYPFFMSKGETPDSNQATDNWIVPLPSEDILGGE